MLSQTYRDRGKVARLRKKGRIGLFWKMMNSKKRPVSSQGQFNINLLKEAFAVFFYKNLQDNGRTKE